MIKIGLIGIPKSGKTTVFNAVTHSQAEVSNYFTGILKPNIAMVKIQDERLDYLSKVFQTEKTVYATIEYLDFVGMKKEEDRKEVFSSKLLGTLRTVNSLAMVVRGFDIPGKKLNPLEEINEIEAEFIFSDLVICEKRLNTIAKQEKRGVKTRESEKGKN